MPDTTCHTCGHDYTWTWEEAFDKFGFGDGDSQVMTEDVADVLRSAGYRVDVEPWGLHNVVVRSIRFGYDDPRGYLPDAIIRLLDAKLPTNGEAVS
jgi:hypothetical protein